MVVILSRDADLYSTRSLRYSYEQAGKKVVVIDVLQLEVKIGKGVFMDGIALRPALVIPRFSSQILVAGLSVLREWEAQGVSVLNSSQSIAMANDQLASLQCLQHAGVPIPPSSFCSQPVGEKTQKSLLGDEPKVIKLLDSSQGKGVILANDFATKASVVSALATLKSSGLVQRYYADAHGVDYRLVVLRGQVIAAIRREAREGDFRANVHQGGTVTAYKPTTEQVTLALNAAKAIGIDFAGVDIMPTDGGDVVLEVNASPGMEGIEQGEFAKVTTLVAQTFC